MPYTFNPFTDNLDYYQAANSQAVIGPSTSTVGDIAVFNNTTGTLLADSGINTASGQILAPNGSNSAPSYSFASATNAGFFYTGTSVGVSWNGSTQATFGFNNVFAGNTNQLNNGIVFTGVNTYSANHTTVFNEYMICVDTVTAAGAVTIQLLTSPETPLTGQTFVVKDSTGSANTFNITVSGTSAGFNIDGATTYVINTSYGSATFIFNGTQWSII
jgi:hypothetical protein